MNTLTIILFSIPHLCLLAIFILIYLRTNRRIKKNETDISYQDNCASLQAELLQKADNNNLVESLQRDIFYLKNPVEFKYDDIGYIIHESGLYLFELIQCKIKQHEYDFEKRVLLYTIDDGVKLNKIISCCLTSNPESTIDAAIKLGRSDAIALRSMPDNKGECLNADLVKKIEEYNKRFLTK